MSINAPINTTNAFNNTFEETATGPGVIQNGYVEAGFWNTGGAPVTINGQIIPVNGIKNFDPILGKQYKKDIIYDATGSTLLITVIY